MTEVTTASFENYECDSTYGFYFHFLFIPNSPSFTSYQKSFLLENDEYVKYCNKANGEFKFEAFIADLMENGTIDYEGKAVIFLPDSQEIKYSVYHVCYDDIWPVELKALNYDSKQD